MIERLVARGHAYDADGHVLFDVPSMDDYGRLSRRSRDELIAGARVEVAPYKKDAADFVLWKPSTDAQAGLGEPVGPRPAGLAYRVLGHERRACSARPSTSMPAVSTSSSRTTRTRSRRAAAAFGHAIMAKYWMHNGFLNISGEKMSKSLGNFFTVHELLDQYPGEAIRLLLLSAQYRQPLDFTHEGLTQAKAHARPLVWRCCAARCSKAEAGPGARSRTRCADDLNTPLAIAALAPAARSLRS